MAQLRAFYRPRTEAEALHVEASRLPLSLVVVCVIIGVNLTSTVMMLIALR